MITTEMAKGLLDAAKSSYALGTDSVPAGFEIDQRFGVDGVIDDPDTGFKAVALINRSTDEVIVSFAGTEAGTQDWFQNLKLGWDQWDNNQADVSEYLDLIAGDVATVHFTGHSLGGALAQYAAYSHVASTGDPNVTLTTFNGLGGVAGLEENFEGDYDPRLAATITNRHYYVHGDLVARLGDGHVGGELRRLSAGGDPAVPEQFLRAHKLETIEAARALI